MKYLKATCIILVLLVSGAAKAQVSVNINLGTPPTWGPVGYTNARYYYLPDIQAYYDIQSSMFVYNNGKYWMRSTYLPFGYRNYDLYNGYKVVMTNYKGPSPYIYYTEYKVKYPKGYHPSMQPTNGQKHGNPSSYNQKYPMHPQSQQGHKEQEHKEEHSNQGHKKH